MSKLPYGYKRGSDGSIVVVPVEADNIKLIFGRYLAGESLGKIKETLAERQISSPEGNERWAASAIRDLLQNAKYIPIVRAERYFAAQFELDKRSRNDPDTGKRKTARYSSGNTLSGLLICSECGHSYRRVQRASGELVWRCASRVERNAGIRCDAPTITEAKYHECLRTELGVTDLVPQYVKSQLSAVYVQADGSMVAERHEAMLETEVPDWAMRM
ncbi:MAG: recombinase family protein [Oscillospiraceae bacterium]|jgi:hypothetical protein|nr:recombinase family protein [Oscillospiraceae bacterium]